MMTDSPIEASFPPTLVFPDIDPQELEAEKQRDRASAVSPWATFIARTLGPRPQDEAIPASN